MSVAKGENFSTQVEDSDNRALVNDLSKDEPESESGLQNGFTYKELGVAGEDSGQTCPTCGGTGKLNREQERDLVALIPVRDRRLKPRRTVLYLIIAVILCLAICTVAAVLLFPREITIRLKSVQAVNITIPPANRTDPFIILNTTVQVNNSNYFKAKASNITVEVTWDSYVVTESCFGQTKAIPARSSAEFSLLVKTDYHGKEASKLRRICCSSWSYNMIFIIKITMEAESLTTSTQASDSGYRYVNCDTNFYFNKWWDNCVQ